MQKYFSMQQLIKTFDLPLVPAGVNAALEKAGILEKVYYQSTTGSGTTKYYHALTLTGLNYGINQETPHEFRTEPRYIEETFPDLMVIVANQITTNVAALVDSKSKRDH